MGFDADNGIIAEVRDEATGRVDEIMTRGNVLTISGEAYTILLCAVLPCFYITFLSTMLMLHMV
jgi:hypothetical protein